MSLSTASRLWCVSADNSSSCGKWWAADRKFKAHPPSKSPAQCGYVSPIALPFVEGFVVTSNSEASSLDTHDSGSLSCIQVGHVIRKSRVVSNAASMGNTVSP